MNKLVGMALGFLCLGLSTQSGALTITNVSHRPVVISPSVPASVAVSFKLDEPADVKLKIYDKEDYLVRTIAGQNVFPAGDGKIAWNLEDRAGNRVPAEVYHYALEASAGERRVVHDLTDLTGFTRIAITDSEWDREKGEIRYFVPKDVRINIRAGVANGGPLLRTVVDWQPRVHGLHTEYWDGMDADNAIDISKIDRSRTYIDAYVLSSNSIIVEYPGPGKSDEKDISREAEKRKSTAKVSRAMRVSRAAVSPDYRIKVILKGESLDETGDVARVKGDISVKFDVEGADRERMINDRFEPILFVDNVYHSEVESGYLPLAWKLDTSTLEDGEHLITVNIRGYNGQYGTATRRIRVDNGYQQR